MNPPKQVSLSLASFPADARAWAAPLVEAFNQMSLQTTQVLTALIQAQDGSAEAIADASGAHFSKTLTFSTGSTPSDSFPIDVPVSTIIKSVSIAMVLAGEPSGAVTVVAQMLSGGRRLRISNITGLAASTAYSIRLTLEQ